MAHVVYRKFLHWTRTLHTYATMLALILLIFFSFTGFVMNHGGWFDIDKDLPEIKRTSQKEFPATLLEGEGGIGTEHGYQVEAYLRQNEGARGELNQLDILPESIEVEFVAVGRKIKYTINRKAPLVAERGAGGPAEAGAAVSGGAAAGAAPPDGAGAAAPAAPDVPKDAGGSGAEEEKPKRLGQVDEAVTNRNALTLMSDLHKGTGTGRWWRMCIDATAIFLAFASLTGVVLWISLPKRRMLGIVALVASAVLCGACYLFLLA